jgi:hypothetical protein
MIFYSSLGLCFLGFYLGLDSGLVMKKVRWILDHFAIWTEVDVGDDIWNWLTGTQPYSRKPNVGTPGFRARQKFWLILGLNA